MKYFDAAYIAKCYLNEPGAARVRGLACRVPGLCSADFGRLEFTSIIQRHRSEGRLGAQESLEVFADFEQDERNGVWRWLPVTASLIRAACAQMRTLSRNTFLRAGDALHLACAREYGFTEIHTNDRHMLAAAPEFDITGVDVIA